MCCVFLFLLDETSITCTFNLSMQTGECGWVGGGWGGFRAVSRMCYQMISDELTTTPLGTETAQKSLQHKSRENAAGNKCNWIPGFACYVCVCMSVFCMYVRFVVHVCLLSGEQIERGHRTPDHSDSPQKSLLLTMYCAIHILVLMSKVESS